MDKDNFFVKSQIEDDIRDIEKLLATNVFLDLGRRVFHEPVFIAVLLKSNDLLQKFRLLGERMSFNEDIPESDITDLVKNFRDAICHFNSELNLLDPETQTQLTFCLVVGKGSFMSGVTSDYEDDIAFFYGKYRLYLKRHLVRLTQEARGIYSKLYPASRIE